MTITMEHGSGGRATSDLIENIFLRYFDNPLIREMEDAAVTEGAEKIALTTDSFVVTPLFYDGGDIGRLAVCGTVNDLLVSGAVPKYLTCGFIIEEGMQGSDLEKIVASMKETADEAGVCIVSGDTKVVEGKGGMYINTSGVGFMRKGVTLSAKKVKSGDKIILSGTLGEHHAAILKHRMNIKNGIKSDNAPLNEITEGLFKNGITVCEMRDVTRGGLATVIKEIAGAGGFSAELTEETIPVSEEVRDFSGLLGLDPLYMGNEGKLIVFVPENEAERALGLIRMSRYGNGASIIGEVTEGIKEGEVILRTEIGGKRRLDVLTGEGLPRIC